MISPEALFQCLQNLSEGCPLVHGITNLVTMTDCANALLAAGASPVMASAPEEAAEVTQRCDGLFINLGTPDRERFMAMESACRAAQQRHIPVVLDPAGVGLSDFRYRFALQILSQNQITAIRGNAAEIATLLGDRRGRGVDCDDSAVLRDNAVERNLAVMAARRFRCLVVMTGETDLISDGLRVAAVRHGHPLMRLVTGMGCMFTALLTAFLAVNRGRPFEAAVSLACAYGLCGEESAARALAGQGGPGSFRTSFTDGLFRLRDRGPELFRHARFEEFSLA